MLRSAWMRFKRSMISARAVGSSAEVGSSEHHEVGLGDHGAGDAHALLLACRELGWVRVEQSGIEPHEPHGVAHSAAPFRPFDGERLERFGDGRADLHSGIERLGRLLEHQLDLAFRRPSLA